MTVRDTISDQLTHMARICSIKMLFICCANFSHKILLIHSSVPRSLQSQLTNDVMYYNVWHGRYLMNRELFPCVHIFIGHLISCTYRPIKALAEFQLFIPVYIGFFVAQTAHQDLHLQCLCKGSFQFLPLHIYLAVCNNAPIFFSYSIVSRLIGAF